MLWIARFRRGHLLLVRIPRSSQNLKKKSPASKPNKSRKSQINELLLDLWFLHMLSSLAYFRRSKSESGCTNMGTQQNVEAFLRIKSKIECGCISGSAVQMGASWTNGARKSCGYYAIVCVDSAQWMKQGGRWVLLSKPRYTLWWGGRPRAEKKLIIPTSNHSVSGPIPFLRYSVFPFSGRFVE